MPDPGDEALSQSLAAVVRVIDYMTEAVLVIDQHRNVIALNEAAIALLDLENAEAGTRPIDRYGEVITSWRTDEEESEAPSQLARALEGAPTRNLRATITTASGGERAISFSSTPIYDGERVRFGMLTMQDRTESERNHRYWRAVGTAAMHLTSTLEVSAVIESAVDITVGTLGGQVVLGIWRLDEDERLLELRAHRGIGDETVSHLSRLPLELSSLLCEAVAQRALLHEEELPRVPPRHEFDRTVVTRERLGAWITSPLIADGRVIGAMGYGLRSTRRFFTDELDAVAAIAGLFAVAIVHAELFEESQRRGDALALERENRSRFTGAIAHDLRQPLTVIRGNASLALGSGALSNDLRELVQDIHDQTGRLGRMAADLTDAAQITADQFTIAREWIDLTELVRLAARRVGRGAPQHQIQVVEAPDELEGEWDHDRLAQVVENLLTNAVKFTPEGGAILVRVVPEGSEVRVSVEDRGVGIAPEDMAQLFQPFARLESQRSVSGSGLGLFITRSIIEAHGGRVSVQSGGPGHGSTFSFVLPREA